MTSLRSILCFLAGAICLAGLAACTHAPAVETVGAPATSLPAEGRVTRRDSRLEAVSPVYEINRIYKSMTGPWSNRALRLLEATTPELVWITGCHVEMVGADGTTHMPEQFMCHANVDFDADWHNDLFRETKPLDGRLFTLSQGQLHVQFPPGFGIPVMSNETLDLSTQVLNLNVKDRSFTVRHKVDIDFVRDSQAQSPMKPLYERALMGMVSLEGRELVLDQGEDHLGHAGQGPCLSCCVPGVSAIDGYEHADTQGHRFTTHWIVKPGREENRTRATTMMNLPFDTKIHYIAVHMHPFAESLELRDVTADKSLFKSHVRNLQGEIGLADVEYFSSEEGIPVYQDHEYELVSVYNNTTGENQDSMAVMYAYFLDQEYQGPDPSLEHLTDEASDKASVTAASRKNAAGPICNAGPANSDREK